MGTLLGEFELLEVIGEGGFGIVYLALDHSLQRRVAIKEYMPQTLAKRDQTLVGVRLSRNQESFQAGLNSFINEAKLLAQFDHPSLVKVHRFWKANGTAYMVMPLYSGPTLRQELQRRRDAGLAIDEAWLLELLDALTQALAVMHADNCFHRDIAPDNILLLEGSGKPLLLDFGAARTVIGDMTQSLTVILKPGYAPIEQYAEVADMKQGAWTDVYALASSMHFALRASTPPPAVGRLVNDSYVPMAQVPPPGMSQPFLAALDHALQVRPGERTQSMEAFRSDLGLPPLGKPAPSVNAAASAERTQQPGRTGPGSDPYQATRIEQPATTAPTSSRTPLLVAAGAALVVGGALLYWQLGRSAAPAKAEAAPVPATAVALPPAPAPAPAPEAAQVTAPAPVPQPRSPRERFDEVLAAQTAGFAVSASPVQPAFRIDKDKLSFSVTSPRDGFVQVLWLNADGKLTLLFPNALLDKVRIKSGQTLTLPPKQMQLVAAKPQGQEHFLVLVSQQPRDFTGLSPKRVDGFMELHPADTQPVDAAGQPPLAGSVRTCASADCRDYGAAVFAIDVLP
jgi:serine/threonine protein kinase